MRIGGTSVGSGGVFALAVGAWVAAFPAAATAQLFDFGPIRRPPAEVPVVPPGPAQDLTPPNTSTGAMPKGPLLQALPPAGNQTPSQAQPQTTTPPGQVALQVSARFGRDLPAITGGLHWRIFPVRPDQTGAFRPIKEDRAAAPVFTLPPGSYVVHAGFGLASATKPVQLRADAVREVFEIPAGGLRIEGKVGDVKIPPTQISFDIFAGSQFEPGNKRPLAQAIASGDVILLPEGIYHIVSNYGDANAVVRSDIRVQTGKLTDAAVTHRAAVITLKLVNEWGGEALANTQWWLLTPGGDVIKESTSAFPRVILAEGEYCAVARNDDKAFERTFRVVTGVDGEIEVLGRSMAGSNARCSGAARVSGQ